MKYEHLHYAMAAGTRVIHQYDGPGSVVTGYVRTRDGAVPDIEVKYDQGVKLYSHLDWLQFESVDTQPKGCTSATPVGARLGWVAQFERDDWFTQRIDPYDDRIRVLERWMHGQKSQGINGG